MRPDRKRTSNEAGFSLLEVVVAIAVVSLGSLAVINVLGENVRSVEADERRAIAGIVAENRLAEAMAPARAPPTGLTSGADSALNRQWDWQLKVTPSPDPRILRLDVTVREAGRDQIIAELSSFRSAR